MLTDTELRKLRPKEKTFKVADRDGMYVTVSTAGTKSFRYDYRLNGRRETLTIGRYDDTAGAKHPRDPAELDFGMTVSLAEARSLLTVARLQLDRCLSFLGRRSRHPLVLCGNVPGVDGIRVLHRSLYRALDSVLAGGATVDRLVPSMTPHMTLLYSDATVEEHGVSPVRWVVREFQLLYNLRGSPGPYRILAQWPLL
jgi:hypothetical protein